MFSLDSREVGDLIQTEQSLFYYEATQIIGTNRVSESVSKTRDSLLHGESRVSESAIAHRRKEQLNPRLLSFSSRIIFSVGIVLFPDTGPDLWGRKMFSP